MSLMQMMLLFDYLIIPMFWTDGSLVLDKVSGASSSGSGFFAHVPGQAWDIVGGGTSMIIVQELLSVPGGPSSWEVLALQASDAVHLGVDDLNVVRQDGRLLDGVWSSCPVELLNDGDLVMLVDRILKQRSRDTVRVTDVKGQALVRQVRELDRLGNNAADEAADFGRRICWCSSQEALVGPCCA